MLFYGSPAHFVTRVCAVQLHYNTVCIAFFSLNSSSLFQIKSYFFQILNKKMQKYQMNLPHLHHENFSSLNASACCVLSQSEQENEGDVQNIYQVSNEIRTKTMLNTEVNWGAHCTCNGSRKKNHQQSQLQVETHCWLAGYNSMKRLHMFIVMFMRAEPGRTKIPNMCIRNVKLHGAHSFVG